MENRTRFKFGIEIKTCEVSKMFVLIFFLLKIHDKTALITRDHSSKYKNILNNKKSKRRNCGRWPREALYEILDPEVPYARRRNPVYV